MIYRNIIYIHIYLGFWDKLVIHWHSKLGLHKTPYLPIIHHNPVFDNMISILKLSY